MTTESRQDVNKSCYPSIEDVLLKRTYDSHISVLPPIPSSVWLHGFHGAYEKHRSQFWLRRVPVRLDFGDRVAIAGRKDWCIVLHEGVDWRIVTTPFAVLIGVAFLVGLLSCRSVSNALAVLSR